MSNVLIIPGQNFNILDRTISISSSNPGLGFEEESVANYWPSHVFKFADVGTDDYIRADLSQLENGNLEEWNPDDVTPTGFETSGTIAKESTIVDEGDYSAKIAADGYIKKVIWVLAGWEMTIVAALYGEVGYAMSAYVRNLFTGKYLNSSGNWVASAAWTTRTVASWNDESLSFTVESYSVNGQNHLVPLEIKFEHATGGTFGYVDDVALWPHYNFISIHGHNIPPLVVPKVNSDDNSSYSSVTRRDSFTAPVNQPSFYEKLSAMVTERYVELLLDGTTLQDQIYIGDWVLAQYDQLDHEMRLDTEAVKLHRLQNRGSPNFPAARSDREHVEDLVFRYHTTIQAERVKIFEIYDRCRSGVDPVILVPHDNENLVMMCFLNHVMEYIRHEDPNHYEFEFTVKEKTFPLSY
ncbi:MAG: hypothetical protein ACXACX_09275 [Candidatus Hodarchaeales archaeon]|jgi:hypothetical protein